MQWLKNRLLVWLVGSGQIASLIRHAVSAFGGVLVSIGVSQPVVDAWIEPSTDLLGGLLLILVSFLGSRVNKSLEK